MNAIQTGIFQPGLTTSNQEELRKKKEIQNFVLLKIYSFLTNEDKKAACDVCRDWQEIVHPRIDCLRLLEFMKVYRAQVEAPLELDRMIWSLEAGLLKCDVVPDKIFKDIWYSFAKQCSMGARSVVWNSKLFTAYHFSKLFKCANLFEQAAGKNVVVYRGSSPKFSTKGESQVELTNLLIESGHLAQAVGAFIEMGFQNKELGNKLIRVCQRNKEYDSAALVAKKINNLFRVLSDSIFDLRAFGKVDLALDLIQKNDQETNAAKLVLSLSSTLTQFSHPIHRMSDENACLIVERMEKISFTCTKDPDGFRDSKADLMVFLVDGFLERKMVDKAAQVYRILVPHLCPLSYEMRKETIEKIQQYCKKNEIVLNL